MPIQSRARQRFLLEHANRSNQSVRVFYYRDTAEGTELLSAQFYPLPDYQDAGAFVMENIYDVSGPPDVDKPVDHIKWNYTQGVYLGSWVQEMGTDYAGNRLWKSTVYDIPGWSPFYGINNVWIDHNVDDGGSDRRIRSILSDATQLYRGKVNWFISLVELRDIKKLAEHALNVPYKLLGKYSSTLAAEASKGRRVLSYSAQSYLAWVFGVKPIKDDIDAIDDLIYRITTRISKLATRANRSKLGKPTTLTRKWETEGSVTLNGLVWTSKTVHTLRCKGVIRMNWSGDTIYNQVIAECFGLTKMLTSLYSLIPFTFVGDWFLPSTRRSLERLDLQISKSIFDLMNLSDRIFTTVAEVLSTFGWTYSAKTTLETTYEHPIGPPDPVTGLQQKLRIPLKATRYTRNILDMSRWTAEQPFGTLPDSGKTATLGTLIFTLTGGKHR